MESRPPLKGSAGAKVPLRLGQAGLMAGLGLLGSWLMASCAFDDSALFSNETQGIECDNNSQCPNPDSYLEYVCIDRRCVRLEVLSNDVIADLGVTRDGEEFDARGLVLCGPAGAAQALYCNKENGEICCGEICVNSFSDEANCGGCGISCDAGEECRPENNVRGVCFCGEGECGVEETCCVAGGTPICRSLLIDSENCGACGVECSSEARESCNNGQCGCLKIDGGRRLLEICGDGQSCCPPPLDDPNAALGCVDLNTTENCGTCGNKCGVGEACVNGQCTCGIIDHPSPDGLGPVCDTTEDAATGNPREACCFNPNGRQECRPFGDCDCNGAQCTGLQICCYNSNFGFETCIDPTRDGSNCGGCALEQGQTIADEQFTCNPGEVCLRNFNYSLSRDPVEQNAQGIFIGECKLNCATNRAQCPGGINPDTGEPFDQNQQSCIDPLSSNEFCGAMLKADATSTTTGRCSELDPQTFGQLKNFQGVRCGSGETCRTKLFCADPADPTCSPRTHYYYDVSLNSESPDFANALPLPAGAVFTVDETSTQAERDAYIENLYLRAVCDTTCRAGQLRCVGSGGAPVCVDPSTNSSFCGAPIAGDCTDSSASGGPDNDGLDCNNDLPNTTGGQCIDGACTNLVCAPGFGNCDGNNANGCETDITTDPNHCGQCSTATVDASCGTGLTGVQSAICQAGQCIVTCAGGQSNCQNAVDCGATLTQCVGSANVDRLNPGQTVRDGCETNSGTDINNCGACGNACITPTNNVSTATCSGGQCSATECANYVDATNPGFANCAAPVGDGNAATCETRSNELTRCNASDLCLGPANAAGTTRVGNRAFPTNPAQYIDCSNPASFGGDVAATWACVRDAANAGFECQVSTCGPGFFACDPGQPATCFDLSTTTNCSSCGNACGINAVCTGAQSGDCFCTDATGERCRQTGPNYSSASCSGSNCVLSCDPGFADCDGDSANGCEVNINTSTEHCGGCTNPSAPGGATGTQCGTDSACVAGGSGRVCRCSLGAAVGGGEVCNRAGTDYNGALCNNTTGNCALTCSPQRADCDSNVANGCEINTTVPNNTHCGACSTNATGTAVPNSPNNCANVPTPATSTETQCIEFPVASGTVRCAYCGDNRFDGTLNPLRTEQCDDGNLNAGDGCSPTCQQETGFTCTTVLGSPSSCAGAACGNGTINAGEQCDPPPAGSLPTVGCNVDCSNSACGDNKVNTAAGEACDDGNTSNGDGCSSTCQIEAGFTCLPSPAVNGSPSTCTGAACGNGVVNTGEQCDTSAVNTAGCDSDCTFPACGDGLFNNAAGEQCDAAALPTATCNTNCTTSVCGDGRRNPAAGANEACDDGNTNNGDGCSSTCQVETPGFSCTGPDNGLSVCSGAACNNGVVNTGEQCDGPSPGTLPTATCNADCTNRVCGDGKRNTNPAANEACDDGNTLNGDGCSSTCQQEGGFSCTGPANGLSVCTGAACGNSVINSGEQCDDGNVANDDGCVGTNCQIAFCGDGFRRTNGPAASLEQCDPAPAGSLPTATCNTNCTTSVCGDGRRNPASTEQCDDGNTNSGDGCSATCQVETPGFSCTGPDNGLSVCTGGACNNGVVNAGEQCDGPAANSLPTATCNINCTTSACGDGRLNLVAGEQCDDRNTVNGDGCSATCQDEAGFNCTPDTNGSLSVCTISTPATVCGNGVINSGEQCDRAGAGTADDVFPAGVTCATFGFSGGTLTCSTGAPICTILSTSCTAACGNGQLETGEVCDGASIGSATCTSAGFSGAGTPVCNACTSFTRGTCGPPPGTCPNGVLEVGEACDDNNATSNDGCTACAVDFGWSCTGTAPSVCTRSCGNGLKDSTEACDDGNVVNSDGCSSTCTLESGTHWSCSGTAPTICRPICGSGSRTGTELNAGNCDDSNTNNGDGCDSGCKVETGWSCTGNPSVCTTTCGDGLVRGSEVCDVFNAGSADDVMGVGINCSTAGYTGGAGQKPACAAGCLGFSGQGTCGPAPGVVCGNGVRETGEACDGTDFGSDYGATANCQDLGYPGAGTLSCNSNCTLNVSGCASTVTTCDGDNNRETNEACGLQQFNIFGSNLNGAATRPCSLLGYGSGNFTCASGNLAAGGCRLDLSACVGPNLCGNGVINAGEECDNTNFSGLDCTDFGYTGGTLTCTTCSIGFGSCTGLCGNGVIDSGEVCDTNGAAADVFPSNLDTCVEAGFTGAGAPTCNSCTSIVQGSCGAPPPLCGNGLVDTGEDCDGTNLGGATCVSEGFAGGGTLSCSACAFVTTGCFASNCGNGVINSGEVCDTNGALPDVFPSNLDTCVEAGFTGAGAPTCNACTSIVQGSCGAPPANCGNGLVDTGEDCDGTNLGGATCVSEGFAGGGTLSCSACAFVTTGCFASNCGNGVINSGEVCDTNGALPDVFPSNLDTCVEAGFTGAGTLSCNACTSIDQGTCGGPPSLCGNGIIDAGEACDPNGASPDVFPVGFTCLTYGYPAAGTLGCSAACDITLTSCAATVTACDEDNTREANEACDGTGLPAWPTACADLGYTSGAITCATGNLGAGGCRLNLGACVP